MTATLFALTSLETGRALGQALICAEARYAAVRLTGQTRVDRRLGSTVTWREVLHELSVGLPSGPLEAKSWIAQLLRLEARVVVQYVYQLPIGVEPTAMVASLDAWFVGAPQ